MNCNKFKSCLKSTKIVALTERLHWIWFDLRHNDKYLFYHQNIKVQATLVQGTVDSVRLIKFPVAFEHEFGFIGRLRIRGYETKPPTWPHWYRKILDLNSFFFQPDNYVRLKSQFWELLFIVRKTSFKSWAAPCILKLQTMQLKRPKIVVGKYLNSDNVF